MSRENRMKMRDLYKKFTDGDPISDEELDEGIEFFSDLSDKLFSLGDVFRLPAVEANRVLMSLEGFKRERGRLKIKYG